jgi:hypothetical protein
MQPLAANEPVSQKADLGLLRDRLQATVKFLDFAGETLRGGIGKEVEDFVELSVIPVLPGHTAGLTLRPVVHVEPLNMTHRDWRLDGTFSLDQHCRDRAALCVQCYNTDFRKFLDASVGSISAT